MDNFVGAINKLQRVVALLGQDMDLNLPQIVVVGDQSAGKSSVLERLVGHSFIPRGDGITTRCPLIIQLVKKGNEEDDTEIGQFLHRKNKVYTDFDEIRDEIIAETNRTAGIKEDINNVPIMLTISSKNVPYLTIVDLPGIVKFPVRDQPEDIENKVRELILKYIKNPNSIILALVPANCDVVTCESIKLAKLADPNLERTIVVLTKLDLMGPTALKLLSGEEIPVKLGIIGVANKIENNSSQQMSIQQIIEEEKELLQKKYPAFANNHGISALAAVLENILLNHIKNCLPKLRMDIKSSRTHLEEIIQLHRNVDDPQKLLMEILTQYATLYCNKISGTDVNLECEILKGGSKINYIFSVAYDKSMAGIKLDTVTSLSIINAIKNTTGVQSPLFLPEESFRLLVKKEIEKLEQPSLWCLELVKDELHSMVTDIPSKISDLSRFPDLNRKISSVMTNMINCYETETHQMVKSCVGIHLAYINTSHPNFFKDKNGPLGSLKLSEIGLLGKTIEDNSENNHKSKVTLIKKLIESYMQVIKETVQDTVPKTIMYYFVNNIVKNILPNLIKEMYGKKESEGLFSQEKHIADQLINAKKQLKSYKEADQVLSEIVDICLL